MGSTKRQLERLREERRRKQQELLDLPAQLAESHELIGELQAELRYSTETIDELEESLRESNSWRSKLGDYMVGGLIGAVIGILLTWLFGT